MMTSPDWVGLWYTIAKERGVNDICSIGQVNTNTQEVKWFDFSHADMDGVGAFGKRLKQLGYDIGSLPISPRISKPPLYKIPFIFLRIIFSEKYKKPLWKEHNEDIIPKRHDFPWVVFNSEETQALKTLAKMQNVSLNALLLFFLNKILLNHLLKKNTKGKWLFPVNLRGAVRKENDFANHSSAIIVETSQDSTAMEIHQTIKKKLSQQIHWGIWWILHIGKWIGIRGMRIVSKKSDQKNHWFGTFSNMGEWPPKNYDSLDNDPNEAWICTPPGNPNYPISIGCLTWNGKLSVSLKVHPTICLSQNQVWKFLKEFKQKILSIQLDNTAPVSGLEVPDTEGEGCSINLIRGEKPPEVSPYTNTDKSEIKTQP